MGSKEIGRFHVAPPTAVLKSGSPTPGPVRFRHGQILRGKTVRHGCPQRGGGGRFDFQKLHPTAQGRVARPNPRMSRWNATPILLPRPSAGVRRTTLSDGYCSRGPPTSVPFRPSLEGHRGALRSRGRPAYGPPDRGGPVRDGRAERDRPPGHALRRDLGRGRSSPFPALLGALREDPPLQRGQDVPHRRDGAALLRRGKRRTAGGDRLGRTGGHARRRREAARPGGRGEGRPGVRLLPAAPPRSPRRRSRWRAASARAPST